MAFQYYLNCENILLHVLLHYNTLCIIYICHCENILLATTLDYTATATLGCMYRELTEKRGEPVQRRFIHNQMMSSVPSGYMASHGSARKPPETKVWGVYWTPGKRWEESPTMYAGIEHAVENRR